MKKIKELFELSGQTAIVTGGSRGIGLGIAYRLAEAGANVVIASLHDEELLDSVKQLSDQGWKVKGVKADVSKEEDVKNMVKFAVDSFGSVDILVNNAGIFPSVSIANMTKENFDKVIAVNLGGVFLGTKYASEQMIKQGKGGKIINITSIDALHPSTIGLAHYDASKHGVWGFTKNSALELAAHKIWVNAIAPGGISTPGVAELQSPTAQAAANSGTSRAPAAANSGTSRAPAAANSGTSRAPAAVDMSKMLEAFLGKIPMHRMGEPDDIGKVALFLASDMSSYMTGTQLVVDGGYLLS